MHCEGGNDPDEVDRLVALGLRGRPLAPPEPLLRRRAGRRGARRRVARRRRRPAARRPRHRRRVTAAFASAGRAGATPPRSSRSGARSAGEPGGWLITTDDWRSAADERRYLKALRRYEHAAVFVAETAEGELVGRLSLARDQHPASAHVADLGLMVAATHRRRGHRPGAAAARPSAGRGSGA